MPSSDMDKAMELKNEMIDNGVDYLTWTRDEVKEYFEILRLEDSRVQRIVQACQDVGLTMYPAPIQDQPKTRVYINDSNVGQLISSIICPGENSFDDDVFDKVVKKMDSPSPRDIFRKIRDVFEEEGWINLLKKRG